MADRKMSLKELSEKVGIANVNLSKIKTGKISAIRFSTLEAICDVLDCQPGDILEYERESKEKGAVAKQPNKKAREVITDNSRFLL